MLSSPYLNFVSNWVPGKILINKEPLVNSREQYIVISLPLNCNVCDISRTATK